MTGQGRPEEEEGRQEDGNRKKKTGLFALIFYY